MLTEVEQIAAGFLSSTASFPSRSLPCVLFSTEERESLEGVDEQDDVAIWEMTQVRRTRDEEERGKKSFDLIFIIDFHIFLV